MKGSEIFQRGAQGLKEGWKRYKYPLLVLLAGAVLLLLPTGGAEAEGTSAAPAEEGEALFSTRELEARLEEVLSRIDGAGEVTVLLTVAEGTERVLAQDSALQQEEGGLTQERETVVLSTGSGTESAITVQSRGPTFQGALVVCSGGGDPALCLTVTRAVAALTGLGSDRITVCKGNQ